MSLNFLDGQPFATGSVGYSYRPATERETVSRLIVQVEIEGVMTEAIIDTGGVFLICPPKIANRMQLDENDSLGEDIVGVRGSDVRGRLYRMNLKLLAEEGQSLTLEVTALIPRDTREEHWVSELPCFLGLHGCLERLRFAVDPYTETFYFGPIS